MSRIHEALKKAEQERAAVQAGEVPPQAGAPVADAVRRMATPIIVPGSGNSARMADNHAPVAIPAAPGEPLRFEDLQRCPHPNWHLDPNVNVFTNPELSSQSREQFRTLRSRLYQIRANSKLSRLLIASALPNEGKTFVAANLAQAIVRQPDHRVLLIDADLRSPSLHSPFGAPSSPGLTDYLQGTADETAVLQIGLSGNLGLISCGTAVANPSELLMNGRLKLLLDRMGEAFEWIILDSPPCLPVADASLLGDLCDGVLYVIRAGSTPAATAQRACQELQGANVVGVVLNCVDEGVSFGSYNAQGYGYGYGYGNNDLESKEMADTALARNSSR